jgi:hypothetical protein
LGKGENKAKRPFFAKVKYTRLTGPSPVRLPFAAVFREFLRLVTGKWPRIAVMKQFFGRNEKGRRIHSGGLPDLRQFRKAV